MDVCRIRPRGEFGVIRSVDVERDAGEAWIGEGGEEGIDALEAGEGAEEDGGGFFGKLAFDGEAGGVCAVFEEIDGGVGGEFAEVIRAPR